ncbi:hypothetical protein QFZ76_002010 [Streptomyces sp. V4I2]|nr:hypothetical protein [Streptomyces sp. V4I2]
MFRVPLAELEAADVVRPASDFGVVLGASEAAYGG